MNPADLLAHIPLFSALSTEDRDALAARLHPRPFEPGATVFAKGDDGASMYIVASGAVDIFLPPDTPGGPAVVLKQLRAGEYFGELALFDEKPRSASARAVTDAKLLELTRDDFAEHLGRSKTAAMTVLHEMAGRLRQTNELLSQRAAKDAIKEVEENLTWPQRVAERVADLNGSWSFILGVVFLTSSWALMNSLGGKDPITHEWRGFDPYPFQLFNLFLAVLAALQGPLIVMTQNRQSMKDRAQAETDFRVNLKNEVGIEALQAELGAQRAETTKRLEAIERSVREGLARLGKAVDSQRG